MFNVYVQTKKDQFYSRLELKIADYSAVNMKMSIYISFEPKVYKKHAKIGIHIPFWYTFLHKFNLSVHLNYFIVFIGLID